MIPSEYEEGLAKQPLELLKLQKDLLLAEYAEARNHARHVESVRTNAVNFSLLLASALIAVITFDKIINQADIVASILILAIGVSASAFSILYLERYETNTHRAGYIRSEIDRLFFKGRNLSEELSKLRKKGKDVDARDQQFGNRVQWKLTKAVAAIARGTHLFWILMPLLVSAAGIALSIIAITGATVAAP